MSQSPDLETRTAPAVPTALNVAQGIIARADADGQTLELAKLQALLYLCQSWHLALTGQPMFDDPILAGDDGPFIESVESWYVENLAAAGSHSADRVRDPQPSELRAQP